MTQDTTKSDPFAALGLELRRYDPQTTREAEARALHRFSTALRRERLPDDPPYPFEAWRRNQRSWSAYRHIDIGWWVLWRGDEAVAELFTTVEHRDENQHLMWGEVEVAADHRRGGLATRLLRRLATTARVAERSLILGTTNSTQPGGSEFARSLGASPGLEGHTHQLDLARVDRSLLADWNASAPTDRYRRELWTGPVPEPEVDAFLRLREVMNTQPTDDLELEDERWTEADLRQIETALTQRGVSRRILLARRREDGAMVGLTETFWDPALPHEARQGDTGVALDHRGQGIGKWLKAAMIEHLLQERPELRYVRTHNAASNDAMVAINRALGFAPYVSQIDWQLERGALERWLAARSE